MGQPHKHAELIKAWADGAEIQIKVNGVWSDIPNPVWSADVYRIKPKTIRYRNFLWRSVTAGKSALSVTTYEENQQEPRCNWSGFIRWVGDWQEVEV